MPEANREAFIFMKVGDHAGESWKDILARKNEEFRRAGRIFWGYGGASCHPLNQVQPFVKDVLQKQGAIYLLMEPINSNADPEVIPATEYSQNGVDWEPMPVGVKVTGSRYAFVMDEIREEEFDLDLNQFMVGIGNSRDRVATEYLKGRVDKGCLVQHPVPASAAETPKIRKVRYTAKLKPPFAVMLR